MGSHCLRHRADHPNCAVPLFGLAQNLSHGHTLTTILIAMVVMVLTAFSYGRMASLYPSAGSAYSYVSRGLNAQLGFLAGRAMFLDYLLVPITCTIYAALTGDIEILRQGLKPDADGIFLVKRGAELRT